MDEVNWQIEMILVLMASILAYVFGKMQHKKEYKETLRHEIFGDLLSIEIPKAFFELINNVSSSVEYNNFSSKLKELNQRLSILIIFKRSKYEIIKKTISDLDDLITFNEYHLLDGIRTPQRITSEDGINKRKKEINKKLIELYSYLGVDDYKGVLYQGWFKFNTTRFIFKFQNWINR